VRLALLVPLFFGLACQGERRAPVPEVTLSTDDWAPATPVPTEIAEDEAFDVRLVRLDPEHHEERERVCDVSWIGRLTRVSQAEQSGYPVPLSRRRLIRCTAPTGEGWADLVFDSDSAALATYVDVGDRIRVRVLPGRGFEGHPLLAFVAAIGDVEIAPRREEPAGVGARFVDEPRVDQVLPCAVDYVGGIERLDPEVQGDTLHVPVRCRHAEGTDWVDVRFPAITAASSLRLVRGVVVPVRLLAIDGGQAELPVGRYEGP